MDAIAIFYLNRIKAGKTTLDKVPAKWREEVRNALEGE